jgi:hypothetical protein
MTHIKGRCLPQLPYDVLVHIFALVGPKTYLPDNPMSASGYSITRGEAPKPPPSYILEFSQVCRYWRRVALETPTLWDTPLFHDMDLGALMLERAADAPLTIIWPPHGGENGRLRYVNDWGIVSPRLEPQDTEFMDTLDKHIAQISTLDLVAGAEDFRIISDRVLARSTILKKLRLHYSDSAHSRVAPLLDYREHGLSSENIRITHLSLIDCRIRLPEVVAQRIQALFLRTSQCECLVQNIRELVTQTPALVSLRLSVGAFHSTETAATVTKAITLPQLRSVHIGGRVGIIPGLLSYIRAPSIQSFTALASVSWGSGGDSEESMVNFLESALRHQMARVREFPRLTLAFESSLQLSLGSGLSDWSSWEHTFHSDETRSHDADKFETHILLALQGRRWAQFLLTARMQLRWSTTMSSLCTLEIAFSDPKAAGDYAHSYESWNVHGFPCVKPSYRDFTPTVEDCKKLLALLSQLRVLRVYGDAGWPMLEALMGSAPPPPAPPSSTRRKRNAALKAKAEAEATKIPERDPVPTLCLKLRTLHLTAMSLARSRWNSSPWRDNPVSDALEACLRARHMHGQPIHQLRVEQAELHGDRTADEEQEEWKAYFLQWVANVNLDVVPIGTRTWT